MAPPWPLWALSTAVRSSHAMRSRPTIGETLISTCTGRIGVDPLSRATTAGTNRYPRRCTVSTDALMLRGALSTLRSRATATVNALSETARPSHTNDTISVFRMSLPGLRTNSSSRRITNGSVLIGTPARRSSEQ